MKYTVYDIFNHGSGNIEEYIIHESDNKQEAQEAARHQATRNASEKNAAQMTVEIRTNEDFERGTYETIEF